MNDDIVQRLRSWTSLVAIPGRPRQLMAEAADAIEQRDAEIERLRSGIEWATSHDSRGMTVDEVLREVTDEATDGT